MCVNFVIRNQFQVKKTTFILILAYLVYLLQPIYILIDFTINQEFIAQELCENKEKPELKCNGKCYLMKKLEKAVGKVKKIDSDKSTPQNNKDSNETPDLLSKHIITSIIYNQQKTYLKKGNIKGWSSNEFIQGSFSPPPQILV